MRCIGRDGPGIGEYQLVTALIAAAFKPEEVGDALFCQKPVNEA